jgi:hypothetical protein
VLYRFAIPATADHLTNRLHFGRRQCAFEVQVKLQTWQAKSMREQQLDLKARRTDAFASKKDCAALDDFQNCHAVQIAEASAWAQWFDRRESSVMA